jgi:hypothetical protein
LLANRLVNFEQSVLDASLDCVLKLLWRPAGLHLLPLVETKLQQRDEKRQDRDDGCRLLLA